MSDYEITVVGAPSPKKPNGPHRKIFDRIGRIARAALMRPRALALGGVAAFALFVGTPHVGWDYECRYPMRSGEPCRSVTYCAYYGIQGRRVVFPRNGETCKLITFIPPDWAKLMGGRK